MSAKVPNLTFHTKTIVYEIIEDKVIVYKNQNEIKTLSIFVVVGST